VALQAVRSQATVYSGRSRLSFQADLPSLGYRVFRLVGAQPAATSGLSVSERTVDNGIVRVEVTGEGAVSLRDHRSGHELLGSPGIAAVVIADGNDTWGHGLDRLDQEVGRFALTDARVVERGPVRARLRMESAYRSSTLVQDLIIRDGWPLVEVRATLDWGERWRALKLRFPIVVSDPTVTFETAYGELAREPTGQEVHGHRWVDVSGTVESDPGSSGSAARAGLALLNDSKHGFDCQGSELGMTVVRSPVYAHHEPYLPLPAEEHEWQDQGVQRFRYALLPHDGDRVAARVSRAAAELEEPAIALVETDHRGDLPTSGSFVSLEPDTIDLVVLKRWEDGGDLVMRMLEGAGRPTRARLRMPTLGREDTLQVRAHELVTLRVPLDPDQPIERLDLLERHQAPARGT
jgi:alpha-mannosidase